MGCTIYIFHNNALLVRNGEIDRQDEPDVTWPFITLCKNYWKEQRKDLLQHTSFP
uniref:Uncharacterized protein n=1 Tax=Anguilla anguilla TaxID=7936 RepID=A0A0E9RZA9_ANGAN